jgi:hypothetical protein
VDVARHDTDLALARLDDAGAVGADQAGHVLLVEVPLDLMRRTATKKNNNSE